MNNFDVVDHGVRENMKTGSVRDTQIGKPRFDLIPATCLTKLALHYGAGSEKYGDRNWEKGQKITRFMSSAERHFQYFKMGITDENHLMACVWNLFCIDWTLDQIKAGKLPKELDDRTPEMLGGKICTDLFGKIEENIKSKLEKCSKNDKKEPEKCSTRNGEQIDCLDNKKTYRGDVAYENPIEEEGVLPVISNNDKFFVALCLMNGQFLVYDNGSPTRYTGKAIDFFDVFNNCEERDVVLKEAERLTRENKKFVLISEDIYDEISQYKKRGALYGYNDKDKVFDYICDIKNFTFLGINKKLLGEYKIFSVGLPDVVDM